MYKYLFLSLFSILSINQLCARSPAVESNYVVEIKTTPSKETTFIAPKTTESRSDSYFFWAFLGLMPALFWGHTVWLQKKREQSIASMENPDNIVDFPEKAKEEKIKKAS